MQAEKTFHILDERYHVDFDYTGNVQKFEAPYDGIYQIELWGASGGVPDDISYGQGAYTKGSIHLKKGDTFYVYVGEKGKNNRTVSFNGGGYGGYGKEIGWSGGGATDIRLMNGNWNNLEGLKSRVMVAGGGGGVASVEYNTAGGGGEAMQADLLVIMVATIVGIPIQIKREKEGVKYLMERKETIFMEEQEQLIQEVSE